MFLIVDTLHVVQIPGMPLIIGRCKENDFL